MPAPAAAPAEVKPWYTVGKVGAAMEAFVAMDDRCQAWCMQHGARLCKALAPAGDTRAQAIIEDTLVEQAHLWSVPYARILCLWYFFYELTDPACRYLFPDHCAGIERIYPEKSEKLKVRLTPQALDVVYIHLEQTVRMTAQFALARMFSKLGSPLLGAPGGAGSDELRSYYEVMMFNDSNRGHYEHAVLKTVFAPGLHWLEIFLRTGGLNRGDCISIQRQSSYKQFIAASTFASLANMMPDQVGVLWAWWLGRLQQEYGERSLLKATIKTHKRNILTLLGQVALAAMGAVADRLNAKWYHLIPGYLLLARAFKSCPLHGVIGAGAMLHARPGGWMYALPAALNGFQYKLITDWIEWCPVFIRGLLAHGRREEEASDEQYWFSYFDSNVGALDGLESMLTARVGQTPGTAHVDSWIEELPQHEVVTILALLARYRANQGQIERRTRLPVEILDVCTERIRFNQIQLHENDPEPLCACCQATLDDGEPLRRLPCNHSYHLKCIDEWFTRRSTICPMCRGDPTELCSAAAKEQVLRIRRQKRERDGGRQNQGNQQNQGQGRH